MKNRYRKASKRLLVIFTASALGLLCCVPGRAYTADTEILPAPVEVPEDGCVLVGVEGSYAGDSQKALDRINEIRREACMEGVPNPSNPARKLTMDDYVPIQWSAGLEKIARIRAAEATLVSEHTRPNGRSCFSLSVEDSALYDSGETLAWNSYSDSMVDGIDQWYDEKEDWVEQDATAVTGHYTIMIDPGNTHVGVSCMTSDQGYYGNTTCGRFGSSFGEADTSMAGPVKDCIQPIEIQEDELGRTYLKKVSGGSTGKLKVGDTVSYELMVKAGETEALVLEPISFSTSAPEVATVDHYGKVTGVGQGSVKITAVAGERTASVSLDFKKKSDDSSQASVPDVKSLKVKAGAKKLMITWKKASGAAGYELQVSEKKNFKGAAKVKLSKSQKKYVAKKLKSKKKYYVRIRAYKKYTDEDGGEKTKSGSWTKVGIKTK